MYAAKALCVVHVMCSRSRSGHNRSNDRNGGSAAKYEVAIELERVVLWDRNNRYTTGTYKWRCSHPQLHIHLNIHRVDQVAPYFTFVPARARLLIVRLSPVHLLLAHGYSSAQCMATARA